MRLLVTDATAQPPHQATAWLILTFGIQNIVAELLRRMKRLYLVLCIAALCGFTFGISVSYVGSFIESRAESRAPGFNNPLTELFSLFSIPGEMIARHQTGRDWKMGEVWTFRNETAIWNSLIWTSFALIFGLLYLVFLRQKRLLQT